MGRFKIFCIVLVSLVIFANAGFAIMVEYDLNRLVGESSDIVTGKVVKVESHTPGSISDIVTDVTIGIGGAIKGEAKESITARYPGGQITFSDGTGIGLHISDTPRFEQGEEVLLFLNKEQKELQYRITANYQGKFTLITDKVSGRKTALADSKILVDPQTLKTKEVKAFKVPLEDLIAKIKEIAAKTK